VQNKNLKQKIQNFQQIFPKHYTREDNSVTQIVGTMKFHLSILFSLILFAIDYCNGSNCDEDYAKLISTIQEATGIIGTAATEIPYAATIMNSINFILGKFFGDDGSCLLKEVDYRIEKHSAKVKVKQAVLFLRGIAQSIRDKAGCNDNHTAMRCIKSLKNSYTWMENLRLDLKTDHYKYFDVALKEDEFDDPALYTPFVLYGQLEHELNDILWDLCGSEGTYIGHHIGNWSSDAGGIGDSVNNNPECNLDKIRENKNSIKSSFKFFLRVGTDLYGYRTMSRFNDKPGGVVARKMKHAGDKILRPWILILINRLKDKTFRSIMDIGGDKETWNKNPEKFLESTEFWWDNFEIDYPFNRDTSKPSSFVPVPIRSSDWISLRCSHRFPRALDLATGELGVIGSPIRFNTLGGKDSWLSCAGDTKGYDFDDYCKFRACPNIMAGQGFESCGSELFQIQSTKVDKTLIRSGNKIGLKFENNYWLSRYKHNYDSEIDGDETTFNNMPCPHEDFDPSDLTSCGAEVWSISRRYLFDNDDKIIRHGDLVSFPLQPYHSMTCFIFKNM